MAKKGTDHHVLTPKPKFARVRALNPLQRCADQVRCTASFGPVPHLHP